MDPINVRVLLVDDDENAFILLRRLLSKISRKQFQVEWAADYEAGLKGIKRHEHDVYLVDYRLGGASGLDLLREAVEVEDCAPIIILTGADDPKVDLEATRMGASDFLVKDHLDPSTLERSIRYSMQHYATLTALKKSHERFRLLFERSMDAILISDDEGKIIEVNGAAYKLLGYFREQLLEMKMSDLLSTEAGSRPNDLQDQSFGEISFTLRTGERRFAEFSACQFAPNLNLNILRDITERRNLEKEIQEISEKEQRRLGQDLHDGLGQSLTGISFLTKVLQQKLASKKVAEEKDAALIVNLIKQALLQAREVARGLCPTVLDTNDIQAALEQLAENIKKYFSVACRAECDPDVTIKDNAVAVHLYRIAQEATTNAIKHGKSKKISISLAQQGGVLTLRIKDNGVGFNQKAISSKGMGLRVMQHRARMIGATLNIEPAKEGGTAITCKISGKMTLKKVSKRNAGVPKNNGATKSKAIAAVC
ncbi:MAG: response regulator [Verrucomicrobiota bacterium]